MALSKHMYLACKRASRERPLVITLLRMPTKGHPSTRVHQSGHQFVVNWWWRKWHVLRHPICDLYVMLMPACPFRFANKVSYPPDHSFSAPFTLSWPRIVLVVGTLLCLYSCIVFLLSSHSYPRSLPSQFHHFGFALASVFQPRIDAFLHPMTICGWRILLTWVDRARLAHPQ